MNKRKLTDRNRPKSFERYSGYSYSYSGYSYSSAAYFYSAGECRRVKGAGVGIRGENLKGRELDRVINWLQRAREYQKHLKAKYRRSKA